MLARTGPIPTLIEWDNDVPDWPTLRDETLRGGASPACVRARDDAGFGGVSERRDHAVPIDIAFPIDIRRRPA